ncbi:MAG: hypothetical protein QM802_21975 [Agriterribacter sp.]
MRIKSIATSGIRRKKEKIPNPGTQGPLGETSPKINTVATATI